MAVPEDRIEMAGQGDELTLDTMFEWLEQMHIPEGFKTEIVEGGIYVTPQRDTHWEIIADIYEQLRTKYPRKRVKSDVRIDYPGHLNGFASDVVALAEGARKDEKGHWRPADVEFVAEMISKDTAKNDYGLPKDGVYRGELSLDFGEEIDLTGTVVGLVLKTEEFPRD